MTNRPVPKVVLVIPTLWALLGFTAAFRLGIVEDAGLLVAALIGTGLLVYRDRQRTLVAAA